MKLICCLLSCKYKFFVSINNFENINNIKNYQQKLSTTRTKYQFRLYWLLLLFCANNKASIA